MTILTVACWGPAMYVRFTYIFLILATLREGAVDLCLRARRLRGGAQLPKVTSIVSSTVRLPSPSL